MTETFYATQQVRVLTGQGWPPAGIECCVVRGRPRLRSVHRERAGRVIEPRKGQMRSRRCLKCGRPYRRPCSGLGSGVRRGRRAGHVRKGRPGTWEISSSPPLRGGAGAAVEVVQAHGESSGPGGSEGGRSGGSAERRKRSEARGGARSRSRLIVPMRSGNPLQGTRQMGSGRPDDGACGGTDGGDVGPRGHLNTTTQDSGAGSERAEADPDDAGAPYR